MTNWITDRQPTEADGDKDRLVVARHDGLKDGQILAYWDDLIPGTHWRHTYRWTPPVEPPAKPDFKLGQVWRTRKGMICEIVQISNGCKEGKPIRSNLHGLHWHSPNGKSCLATYGQDHEDDLVELIREASPEPPATVANPRRFVSVRRTILRDGDHILDAIDDQGTAWWRRLDTSPHHPAFPAPEPEWQQLSPLPSHEVPAQ